MKLYTKDRNIFVVSDTHYSHKNIIKSLSSWTSGANRDFISINHHNDIMVSNINNTVGEDDILFLLGDFVFGGFENIKIFRNRINCKEIYFVLGNHDHHIKNNRENIQDCFTSVSTELNVIIDDNLFIMYHYPINEWVEGQKGSYHLFGHVHSDTKNRFFNGGRSMDVGIDGHPEFRPYNIKEVLFLLKDKEIIKHH